MTVPGDFTKIYERYRLVDAISYHEEKAAVCHRQYFFLLVTTLVSLALAVAGYALAGLKVNLPNEAEFWAVGGSIMLSVTLALVTAMVVSDYGRQETLHRETAQELAAMREAIPEPSAGEPEVSRWVWQTETILHGAQGDPRPLRAAPTASPAGRQVP